MDDDKKKIFNWTNSQFVEKSAREPAALEFFLTVLFFILLILTAAAFLLLSPLFIIPMTNQGSFDR
jgi:hypothetical protein